MARYTYSVQIRCSPTELFAVLMDASANCRWQTGVVQTRCAPGGDTRVGTTITEVREFAGYRTTIVYRLVELQWARRATIRLVDGPLRGTATYACRETAAGTELTVTSDVMPQGRWRLAGRALTGVLAAELALSCDRLKALLEQPVNTPAESPVVVRSAVLSPA